MYPVVKLAYVDFTLPCARNTHPLTHPPNARIHTRILLPVKCATDLILAGYKTPQSDVNRLLHAAASEIQHEINAYIAREARSKRSLVAVKPTVTRHLLVKFVGALSPVNHKGLH